MAHIKHVKTSSKDRAIDQELIKMASDETMWDKETHVQPKSRPTSIRFSPRIIQRAKFFARIHRERGYQSWLKRIVEERIETEYQLYKQLKDESL
jgi:hypothetical protein